MVRVQLSILVFNEEAKEKKAIMSMGSLNFMADIVFRSYRTAF